MKNNCQETVMIITGMANALKKRFIPGRRTEPPRKAGLDKFSLPICNVHDHLEFSKIMVQPLIPEAVRF